MTQLRKRMLEELQRRDYSQSTARIYLHVISDFAKHFRRSPDTLGPEQIRQYQLHLFHRKLSPYTIRQHTAALRFFYFKTLHRNFRGEYIPFPKFRKRLPTILSPEEVARLIDSASNLFHRTLIMTLYSTAMRRASLPWAEAPDPSRAPVTDSNFAQGADLRPTRPTRHQVPRLRPVRFFRTTSPGTGPFRPR